MRTNLTQHLIKTLFLLLPAGSCMLAPCHAQIPETAIDSLVASIGKSLYTHSDQAKDKILNLYNLANKYDNLDLFIEALYWDALAEYARRNEGSRSSERIDSLLSLPEVERDSRRQALLYHSLSMSRIGKGDFMNAFRAAHQAFTFASKEDDSLLISNIANTLGNISHYLQDYESSDTYYNIALQYSPPESVYISRIQLNRSRLKELQNQSDSAVLILREAIPAIASWKDTSILVVANINMGSYFTSLGKPDSAYHYYQQALKLVPNIHNNNLRMTLYGNIGNYFRNKEIYDTALLYYRQVRAMAVSDSNISQYAYMAYEMSKLFMATHQPDSAYSYLNEYNNYLSRIQQPQTTESYKEYANLVMESSQQQIKISEQETLLKSKQLSITIIIFSSATLAIVLVLLITIERKRRMRQMTLLKEVENNELAEQLEHEQKIQRLQQEQVEQKSRELSSYSLLLANKNSLLKDVEELTEKQNMDNYDSIRRQIIHLIKDSLRTDEDYWNSFSIHFTQVNPHFFENLDKRFPGLTPNEIKLCAYIKIGMSSKQIAQMLNLSPRSVNTNRYRMRKKYGLAEDEDLDTIIKQL